MPEAPKVLGSIPTTTNKSGAVLLKQTYTYIYIFFDSNSGEGLGGGMWTQV